MTLNAKQWKLYENSMKFKKKPLNRCLSENAVIQYYHSRRWVGDGQRRMDALRLGQTEGKGYE